MRENGCIWTDHRNYFGMLKLASLKQKKITEKLGKKNHFHSENQTYFIRKLQSGTEKQVFHVENHNRSEHKKGTNKNGENEHEKNEQGAKGEKLGDSCRGAKREVGQRGVGKSNK